MKCSGHWHLLAMLALLAGVAGLPTNTSTRYHDGNTARSPSYTQGSNAYDYTSGNFFKIRLKPNSTKLITSFSSSNKTVVGSIEKPPVKNKPVKIKGVGSGWYQAGSVGSTRRPDVTTQKATTYHKVKVKYKGTTEKQYTQIATSKRKPVRRKPVNNKQNDYVVYHIPSPNPMPEVTSYSPQYTFGSPNSVKLSLPGSNNLVPLDAVETSSNGIPFEEDLDGVGLNIPLGQVNFDMVPGTDRCPSLHLSTNGFGPLQKQECPDLNIVVNSHYNQNSITDRTPVEAGAPVEAVVADEAVALADAPAADAPAAAPAAATAPVQAAPAAGGSGGPVWGFPNLPGLPEIPQLPGLPDFKGLFGLLRAGWNLLARFINFIWPILIGVPTFVFFKSLIVSFLLMFPWWIPALWVAVKSNKKKDVVYHKHNHKPIYHPDGWFWNHTTKTAPIGDTIKQLSNQLIDFNSTSQMMLDTRTPPKVKQHLKRDKLQKVENSHPGIAEPVDEESISLEETTKKATFYKSDKPTTDSGLSTWILLSGQGPVTAKPTKKSVKNVTNTFAADDNKVIKPLFKRKTTTSESPASSSITTAAPEKTTKLTKVKASLLNSAVKNSTQVNKKATTPLTVSVGTTTTTTVKPTKEVTKKTTEFVKITTKPTTSADAMESNSVLEPEAKEGALDLSNTTPQSKKAKRPVTVSTTTVKRKKTKGKRKRPTANDKIDNNTKVANKNKEKPFGTQIYNYLSREVMPTVGVGLVGLMVTAGLASYFLYPFGPARRSYEIDRKDKIHPYYYQDEYSGGIAEEEAIGKVIAGMPNNNIRSQNSRNRFQNRYRQVDQQNYYQGSVETVHLNPETNYQTADLVIGSPKQNNHKESYEEIATKEPEDPKKFVVGSVPKEVQEALETATPAVVPEHGPRTIEESEQVFVVHPEPEQAPRMLRLRRNVNDHENEIDSNLFKETTPKPPETTTYPAFVERTESIIDLLRDLFYYKLRLGLQLLQSKTESLSRYFKTVQERIEGSYRGTQTDQ